MEGQMIGGGHIESDERRREMETERYVGDFVDSLTTWYRGSNLERRVEEEMLRSARHGHTFVLLGLHVSGIGSPGSEVHEDSSFSLTCDLSSGVTRESRRGAGAL